MEVLGEFINFDTFSCTERDTSARSALLLMQPKPNAECYQRTLRNLRRAAFFAVAVSLTLGVLVGS